MQMEFVTDHVQVVTDGNGDSLEAMVEHAASVVVARVQRKPTPPLRRFNIITMAPDGPEYSPVAFFDALIGSSDVNYSSFVFGEVGPGPIRTNVADRFLLVYGYNTGRAQVAGFFRLDGTHVTSGSHALTMMASILGKMGRMAP